MYSREKRLGHWKKAEHLCWWGRLSEEGLCLLSQSYMMRGHCQAEKRQKLPSSVVGVVVEEEAGKSM